MTEESQPLSQRQMLRIASRIIEQLASQRSERQWRIGHRVGQVLDNLERLQSLRRQMQMAAARGWNSAAQGLLERMTQALRDVPYYANEAEQAIRAHPRSALPIREILAELRQAQDELGPLKLSDDGQSLSIVTEPIELDDTYLGEFQIQLDLARAAREGHSAYRVIALDPHPAASNSSITHPHVSDEHLCEGDATAPIRSALAEGRLCDFFQMVVAVLTHYNSGSPYVSLADWDGVNCYECGYTTGSDNLYGCCSCEESFCSECLSSCRTCDDSTCRSCLSECAACGDPTCPSCQTTCPQCGRTLCRDCRQENQCPCLQEKEDPQHDTEPQASTARGAEEGQTSAA